MKSAGASLCELYLEWSRGGLAGITPTNYVSEEDVYAKWREFEPVRTSIDFLFESAEKNGYEPLHLSYLLQRGTIVESAEYLLSKMSLKSTKPVFGEGSFWEYAQTHWRQIPKYK